MLFIAVGLAGLCLILIVILIVIIASTRRQITTLHITIKSIKDGCEYPIPLGTVLPTKSTSSDDSGHVSDTFDATGRQPPARQNTYVDEGQNINNNSYEKLNSSRNSNHSYQETGRKNAKPFGQLTDDAVSQASSHGYELLPGMNSQPGSKTGSLRSRANVPLSIAEQAENNVVRMDII